MPSESSQDRMTSLWEMVSRYLPVILELLRSWEEREIREEAQEDLSYSLSQWLGRSGGTRRDS